MSQPRLFPRVPATTGTCGRCEQVAPTFLYDAKAPPPWWYMVEHRLTVDGLEGGFCPGGGFPAVEQDRPR